MGYEKVLFSKMGEPMDVNKGKNQYTGKGTFTKKKKKKKDGVDGSLMFLIVGGKKKSRTEMEVWGPQQSSQVTSQEIIP